MNDTQKKTLLKIARDTVQAVVNEKTAPEIPRSDDPALNETCGCFVTLKSGDNLRGCIGQFTSDIPIIRLVSQIAKASATSDPRFVNYPIVTEELNALEIEISVLSPLKKTSDPLSLRLGIDGIYIKKGGASGCFLPQVATETNWDTETFLSYCCSHKAGLPADAWQNDDTDVFLFTAEVFGAKFTKI